MTRTLDKSSSKWPSRTCGFITKWICPKHHPLLNLFIRAVINRWEKLCSVHVRSEGGITLTHLGAKACCTHATDFIMEVRMFLVGVVSISIPNRCVLSKPHWVIPTHVDKRGSNELFCVNLSEQGTKAPCEVTGCLSRCNDVICCCKTQNDISVESLSKKTKNKEHACRKKSLSSKSLITCKGWSSTWKVYWNSLNDSHSSTHLLTVIQKQTSVLP